MGDPSSRSLLDPLGIRDMLTDIFKRLRNLEKPTGLQVANGRLKVKSVNTSDDVNAGGNVAASNVTATNSVSGTNVTASAAMAAPQGTFAAALGSIGAYGNALTGTTRSLAVDSTGRFGYVSSPARMKTNISDAAHDPLRVLQIQARTYQYVAEYAERIRRAELPEDDPEYDPDYKIATNLGLIAEELEALGFGDLVFYNEDGTTAGVRYELVGLLALEAVQYVWQQVQQLIPPLPDTLP